MLHVVVVELVVELHLRKTRHVEHPEIWIELLERMFQIGSADTGHDHIEQTEGDGPFVCAAQFDRVRSRCSFENGVPLLPEALTNESQNEWFVIDDQDRGLGCFHPMSPMSTNYRLLTSALDWAECE